MPYGFGSGFSSGFTGGVNAGTNMADSRTRKQALIQEQVGAKIEQTKELISGGIDGLQKTVAQVGQRSPQVDQMIESTLGQYKSAAQMLASLPGGQEMSQMLMQQVEMSRGQILTASELATKQAEVTTAQYGATKDYIAGQAAPTGAPAPGAPTGGELPPMQQTPAGAPPMAPQMYGQPGAAPSGQAAIPASMGQAEPGVQQQPAPQPGMDPALEQKLMADQGFGPTTFDEKLAEEKAKDLITTQRQSALDAQKILDAADRAEEMLNDDMITGPWADSRMFIHKARDLAGFGDDEAMQAVRNSEQYLANMAIPTAQIIKNFGAGTGLSDADREFAAKAAGGDLSLDKESLKRIVAINKIAAYNMISTYNGMAPPSERRPLPPKPPERDGYINGIHPESVVAAQREQGGGQSQGGQGGGQGNFFPVNYKAIEFLRSNPGTRQQFEQTFGMSADQFLGQ